MPSGPKLLLVTLALAAPPALAGAAQYPYLFLADTTEAGDEYCLYYELSPVKAWTRKGGARIAFDFRDGDHLRYATFSLGRLAVVEVTDGKSKDLAETKAFRPEGQVRVTVQRRSRLVRVIADDTVLLSVPLPPPPGGQVGSGSHGGQINCLEGLLQPIAPVYFTDDFTRGAEGTGSWETFSGTWVNTELKGPSGDPGRSADPFSFRCSAPTGALAATGYWFWDVYRARTSVRAISAEAVGLCAYLEDADNYLVFRWQAGDDTAPKAKQLVLVTDGRERVLDQQAGGFEQGQWYRLGLEVGNGVAICKIDRDEVFRAKTDAFGQGRVGLWAQGQAVSFDDVEVSGAGLRPRPLQVNEEYLQDPVMSAQGLYNAHGQWRAAGEGTYWHRGVFFGNLSVRLPAQLVRAGAVKIALKAGEPDLESGYIVAVRPEGDRIEAEIRRGDVTVSRAAGLLGNEQYVAVAWQEDGLSVLVGQDEVASVADHRPPIGRRLAVAGLTGAVVSALTRPHHAAAYRTAPFPPEGNQVLAAIPVEPELRGGRAIELHATRAVPAVGRTTVALTEAGLAFESSVGPPASPLSLLEVTADNWLDYTFADAPTDWYATKGDWHIAARWPCRLGWTFLGSVHHENPVVWTKHSYEGDIVFEVRTSIQADLRKSPGYSDPSDLDLALCGDGLNLDSGYAFIYAGWGNTKSAILRKGQIVAENRDATFINPTSGNLDFHRHWFRLRAEKLGNRIRLLCDDQLVCEYVDPDPLRGGRAAMWSAGNNLMVARAQLWYEKEAAAPLPRLPAAPPPREQVERIDVTDIWNTFEQDMGEWHTPVEPVSVRLDLDETTASAGKRSLRITNLRPGGAMVAHAVADGLRAGQWRNLSFDYRIPPEVEVNVYLYLHDAWHVIRLTGNTPVGADMPELGKFQNVQADDKWHHAEFDLAPSLKRLYPQRQAFPVDLAFASPDERYLRCGIGGNPMGATYWVDEFRLTP